MFFVYLRRELRRRLRQTIFIALGLALGVGLVITVTAASSGVKNAQASVLHSLYGVGTDITVTKTPAAGSGGAPGAGFRGRTGSSGGTKISASSLSSMSLGTLASSSVSSISRLTDVSAVAGGLTLTDMKISGKIPSFSSGSKTAQGGSGGGSSGGSFHGNISSSSFTVSGVDLSSSTVGPLSSAKIKSGTTFTTSDATSNVAVVNSDYATQKNLKVGSTVTIDKAAFKVIGIVSVSQGSSPPDVYIPLARAQALSGLTGKVNMIYVAAASASDITAVSKEISALAPTATVTTSSDLASEVTGSLSSASRLANNLGRWLAIAVLLAAFLLASLLTMAAVSRRVREFGTLKALGWRSRRIVGQVMGESFTVGIIGGIAGVALGFAGAAIVSAVAPSLTASAGQAPGSAAPGGARSGGGGPGGLARNAVNATQSVAVHLTASVTVDAVALAVALAIAGGLIAGCLGGWRAARLRPAAALARVA